MFGVSFFNQMGKQKDVRSMHCTEPATERYSKALYNDLYADHQPRGENPQMARRSFNEEQLFEAYGSRM